MEDLFLKLLNMSITAGWMILAVLCVRFLFRKIPKWVCCLLWGMVALRLVMPFSIESAFSLLPGVEPVRETTVEQDHFLMRVPSIDSKLPFVEQTINPMLRETFAYEETDSAAPWQVVTGIAAYVWAVGIVLLLLFAVVSMVRLYLLVREAVHHQDNVYLCDAVKSPFLLGVVRPKIYLPSALTEKEMEYILAHERAHLWRRDYLWKLLGYILLCIYWFNPLCVLAYLLFCKDIELACDEKVIREMSLSDKKEYSRVLLSCATQRRFVFVCPVAFGEVGVKERVKVVLNYKKTAGWVIGIALVVCAVVMVCFLTNPSKEYRIKITIPAGNSYGFCYSDEEISSKKGSLTIAKGGSLGDAEVILLPVEFGEENASDEPIPVTAVAPAKIKAEKGVWYQIGVNMRNPTAQDMDVYVTVSDVEVRIASGNRDENSIVPDKEVPQSIELSQEAADDQTAVSGEEQGNPEAEAYLSVYMITENDSVTINLPLSSEQVTTILSEERKQLGNGYGFIASLWMDGKEEYFTENSVPQTVVDLAVEKCGYLLASPAGLQSPIKEARLDCNWLEEPICLGEEKLSQLEKILKGAEYIGVGNCGYGAVLTLTLENGEQMTLFKGTDDCGSICFGSWGGYSISSQADQAFWEMFGLGKTAKERREN
ncbi:MAG: M56 family metallopeptidase [Acetatifactor sp.]